MAVNKRFSDMSQDEINSLTKEEFRNVSPFEKKSCYDCGHLKAAMSWWCTNKEAIKKRGTSKPGCLKCAYWKPDWSVIDKKYKTELNGYKSIFKKIEEKIRSNNSLGDKTKRLLIQLRLIKTRK